MTQGRLQSLGRLAPKPATWQAWARTGMAIAAAVAIAGLSPAPAAAQAPNSDAFWATFTQPVAGAPQVIDRA